MELNKPNDILVTSMLAPDASVGELWESGVNAGNTSLLTKDEYKESDFIKDQFSDESGTFDDVKFDEYYAKAQDSYKNLSDDEYITGLLKWDPYDLTKAPNAKVTDNSMAIEKDTNPYKNLYGRTSLDSIDMGELSIRELAQQSMIFDTKAGKFREESANDLGLFGATFGDTLVYAQYDEDGPHENITTGQQAFHRKGDYKLDPKGNFYIETLAGRDVSHRQVVKPSDLITTDEAAFNNIDFFDSDGRNKSIVGTAFKVATDIAPFLINPTVGLAYGGFKVAKSLTTALPKFYKALEGILLGDTTKGNETSLYKAATKTHGFFEKFNASSYSDRGGQSFWTHEQMGDMVGSIFSQLYEQRAASSLAKLFFKTKVPTAKANALMESAAMQAYAATGKGLTEDVARSVAQKAFSTLPEIAQATAKQANLGKALSLGYMALTSTADIYQEGLDGGYDRRAAGLAAVVAGGAMYSLISKNNMGDWFLEKTLGGSQDASRVAIKKVVKGTLGQFDDALVTMNKSETEGLKGLAKAVAATKKKVNELFIDPLAFGSTSEAMFNSAIIEGVEEVTEEVLEDAVKGSFDALSSLGIIKSGSFNTVDNLLSAQGIERYLASMFGGFVGGGLFAAKNLGDQGKFNVGKSVEKDTQYELLRLISEGRGNDIKAELDRNIKNLGNNHIAAATSKEGDFLLDKETPQAATIVTAAKNYIDYLESILNKENLKETDEGIISKALLDEIRINDINKAGVHNWIISDFNVLSDEIVKLHTEIDKVNLTEDSSDKSTKLSELTKKLEEKREDISDIVNGTRADDYKALTTFVLNRDLHKPFTTLNKVDYAKVEYNVNYYDLPDTNATLSKEIINEEFKEVLDSEGDSKAKMKHMFNLFKGMTAKYSTILKEYSEINHLNGKKKLLEKLTAKGVLNMETLAKVNKSQKMGGLTPHALEDLIAVPFVETLKERGILDTSGMSEEARKEFEKSYKDVILPVNDMSPMSVAAYFKHEIEKGLVINGKDDPNSLMLGEEFLMEQLKGDEYVPEEVIQMLQVSMENSFKNTLTRVTDDFKSLDVKFGAYFKKLSTDAINADGPEKDLLWNASNFITQNEEAIYFDFIKNYVKIKEKLDSNSYKTISDLQADYDELGESLLVPSDNYPGLNVGDVIVKKNYALPNLSILEQSKSIPKIEKFINSAKKVDSKLFELLKNMQVELYGDSPVLTNVFKLLEEEQYAVRVTPSLEELTRTDDQIAMLEKAVNIIDAASAVNNAMLENEISLVNPYSFNSSIQNYLKATDRADQIDKFPTINAEAYSTVRTDLDRVKTRLQGFIEIAKTNSESIVNSQEKVKDTVNSLFLKAYLDEKLDTSLYNLKVDGKLLITKDEIAKILDENDTDELRIIELEERLFMSFQTKFGLNPTAALKKIEELFNTEEFKQEVQDYTFEGFTLSTKKLSTVDYFNRIHTALASSGREFYTSYRELLKTELTLDDKKAPFFGQEYALRYLFGQIKNNSYTRQASLFLNSLSERPLKLSLENFVIVTGTGGVGKTRVIANFLQRMFKEREFVLSAPTQDTLNTLEEGSSKDTSVIDRTTILKGDLMKQALGESFQAFYDATTKVFKESKDGTPVTGVITDNTEKKVLEIERLNFMEVRIHEDFLGSIQSNLKRGSIVVIDEASHFDSFELAVLDHLSKKLDIKFIGFGDELQLGKYSGTQLFSFDTFNFIGPPKLQVVVRANNSLKKENIEQLEISTREHIGYINDKIPPNPIKLFYDEKEQADGSTITHGDKLVSSLTTADINKLNTKKNVAIITDDGTLSEKYLSMLEDSNFGTWEVVAKDKVQGREFDQVVVLANITPEKEDSVTQYLAAKWLYTLASRGKDVSLLVGNTKLFKTIGITNEQKTSYTIELGTGQIEGLLESRIEALEKVKAPEQVTSADIGDSKIVVKPSPDKNIPEPDEKLKGTPTPPAGDPKHPQPITKTEEERVNQDLYDGNNKFMLYSFYNMLNAKESGKKLIRDKVTGDGMNLQILDMFPSIKSKGKSNSVIISDFIQFKNVLLHGDKVFTNKNNIFEPIFDGFSKGEYVIHKKELTETMLPFGKVHMIDKTGKSRAPKKGAVQMFISKKVKIPGKDVYAYITLASLPDLTAVENKESNWTQTENIKMLQSINESLPVDGEIVVDLEGRIKPLTGIRTIFKDGSSKKIEGVNEVSMKFKTKEELYEVLKKKMPGVQISDLSAIQVFNTKVDDIRKIFEDTGYSISYMGSDKKKVTPSNVPENLEKLRLRPYIKISYTDSEQNNRSKIVILQSQSRSLVEVKKEFDIIKAEHLSTDDLGVKAHIASIEFPSLVDDWAGIKIFAAVLKHFEGMPYKDDAGNEVDRAAYIARDTEIAILLEKADLKEADNFKEALAIFKRRGYDPEAFTDSDKDFLLGITDGTTKIASLGSRVLGVLTEQEVKDIDFGDEVYYNPIYNSSTYTLNERMLSHYKIDAYFEPPVFLVDFSGMISEEKRKRKKKGKTPVVEPTIYGDSHTVEYDGWSIPMDLSMYKEDQANADEVVKRMTMTLDIINSNLDALVGIKDEDLESLRGIISESISQLYSYNFSDIDTEQGRVVPLSITMNNRYIKKLSAALSKLESFKGVTGLQENVEDYTLSTDLFRNEDMYDKFRSKQC